MEQGIVGYGANNMGSNHTGRLPDQETVAAEGTFQGLSCVLKTPVNLIATAYSTVIEGTARGTNHFLVFLVPFLQNHRVQSIVFW